MTNPILYDEVEVFTSENHGKLGLSRIDNPFGFVSKVNAVPITVNEFPAAGRFFPIVFAAGDPPMPVAILGMREGNNVFVNDKGEWEAHVYIPAYVRRYPFILASNEDSNTMTLCIAANAPMVGEDPELSFFEDGKLSKFAEESFEFCKSMQQQIITTRAFMKMVQDLDLLRHAEASLNLPNNEKKVMGSFIVMDEQKLNSLPTDTFMELRNSGALAAIYAQLYSAASWNGIASRQMAANPQPAI